MDGFAVGLLARVAELARRNGLRPSEAFAELRIEKDGEGEDVEVLSFAGDPSDPERSARLDRMLEMLGCDENAQLRSRDMSDLEDSVERAISLSPRSRTP